MNRLFACVVLALAGPVAALTPLALATPPDPSWISGVYDGADYDDVVNLVTSAIEAATSPVVPEFVRGLVGAGIAPHARRDSPTVVSSSLHSRAPPA